MAPVNYAALAAAMGSSESELRRRLVDSPDLINFYTMPQLKVRVVVVAIRSTMRPHIQHLIPAPTPPQLY